LLLTGPAAASAQAAQDEADTPEEEIFVTGVRDIVVNGRARRCRPAAGDPLDLVEIGSEATRPQLMAIVPDGQGGHAWIPNEEQLTGPDYWQRVGVSMDRYVFRAASADRPMCVGRRVGIDGFAGFRRIVDAAHYRGHRLRFTAWVATGGAQQVNFWLAAGTAWREVPPRSDRIRSNRLLNGSNTNRLPFRGNHGWTPVMLETGPIHADAHHISYGFNLAGSGDVWVYQPRLEVVANYRGAPTRDLVVSGLDQR
jgi:hypothetical protein